VTAEFFIYDDIGPEWLGLVGAKSVVAYLDKIGRSTPVTVRINSPGGDVFEGLAMHNAFARHDGQVIVEVDGLAASAASVVAMSGNKIRMAANSVMMIHNAWTIVGGSKSDLRKSADVLDKIDSVLVETYAARTKNSAAQVKRWMEAETWLTATEARSKGFADEIGQPRKVAASVPADRFRNTPQHLVKPAEYDLREILERNEAARRSMAKPDEYDLGAILEKVAAGRRRMAASAV